MLKPKKKITKKEIKRDPLLETTFKVQTYLKENQSLITRSVAAVLVVVVLLIILINRNVNNNEVARTAMGKALVAYAQSDIDNAILQLDYVMDEFGNTKDGALAGYYLGKIYFDRKEYESAEMNLSEFIRNTSNDMLVSNAYVMLAELKVFTGDLTAAISYTKDAVRKSSTPGDKQNKQIRLAQLLVDEGRYQEAGKLINSILAEEDLSRTSKQSAEEVAGELLVLEDRR